MQDYKPYGYLYKHISEPAWLKACFVCMVPAGKKLVLRSGDPSTTTDTIYLRYSITDDPGQTQRRQEEFEEQFNWDGVDREVEIIVGDGEGDTGGKFKIKTKEADLD